ncbi:excinuclease ABC subunit C [Zobellella taiwanensis]|uniref:UvrABC system protein C n=1 Tax=Zobellella taiwanensis TaxID=347535 RepID=A0A2P7R9N1_9GAMM|nr:excinuclease ABC subunit UvrC [Zobellella taiwanensis]PSJ46893.1 excinuclease ABC subunit C [Zobellella taiwanensis]
MSQAFDAKAFLRAVTEQPGVYLMFDDTGTILYVGKAKNLRKRLSSYFRASVSSEKTRTLVRQIADVQVTVTHTETEALILEHNLIKQHLPRYNVLLRDDKSYPYILITEHRHPRLGIHRGPRKKRGEYFGPYPNGNAVRESLHLMQKLFPVRQCEDSVYANRSRPCLQYQLKRCAGPCVPGLVSDEEYAHQLQLARLFLQGKNQQVLTDLADSMEQASRELRFEDAARFRDQLQALRRVQEQQFVSGNILDDLDVIGLAVERSQACVQVLFIRQGKVLGGRSYFPTMPADTEAEEILQSFLLQFYLSGINGREAPAEILLDRTLPDEPLLSDTLSQHFGRRIRLRSRLRTERARFVRLAQTNAHTALASRLAHKSTQRQRLRQLEEILELADITRLECFDISHTMGEKTVASCVVFGQEGPLKSEYRRFNIAGITPGDDYAAMGQALERRFQQAEPDKLPDVLFIDGGLGQLSRAEDVLARLLADSPKQPLLVGVAKGVTRKPGLETLVMGGSHEERHLPADLPALHLIQHIRDESHRFAITGHRAQRGKARTTSSLETIPGVGAKRRQALLKYLGGLQEVKRASVDELAKVPGISQALAEKIHDALHH